MRRPPGRSALSIAMAGMLGASVLLVGSWALAQSRRPRGGQAQHTSRAQPPAPTGLTDAIVGDLEGLTWGLTRDEFVQYHRTRLREEYRPRIARAPGVIEEERIRREMNERVLAIRESWFAFDGTVSGYDHGFLRTEYTHNNQEAMVRVLSPSSNDYYFFIQGRLWKWYRAFKGETFAGLDYETVVAAFEERYGRGVRREEARMEGGPTESWVEWHDGTTIARLVDTSSYGFYVLVLEERSTALRIDTLRPNRRVPPRRINPLIESITREGEAAE